MTEPHKPRTSDEELLAAELPTVEQEFTDDQRVERMRAELEMSFDRLRGTTRAVSIFGSARIPAGDPVYEHAREIARRLGQAGFTIITGGGPGIMEAAHVGAARVDIGLNIGFNISLPFEQHINPSVKADHAFEFHYFFMRKFWFVNLSAAAVIFPGGFGTLDELFELLTLTQTGKSAPMPIVLYGRKFWTGIINFKGLVEAGLISAGDLDLFKIVDSVEEAAAMIRGGTGKSHSERARAGERGAPSGQMKLRSKKPRPSKGRS